MVMEVVFPHLGGGVLKPMLDRIKRFSALKGLPATTKFADPETFYNDLKQSSNDLCVWKGELYFELHRGTYTSHGLVKKLNRKCEYVLRNVEMLWSMVLGYKFSDAYPIEELDRLWKLLLLNQFHDVLPGSSIQMVYVDAINGFEDILNSGQELIEKALEHLTGVGERCYFNPTCWTRKAKLLEVEKLGDKQGDEYLQVSSCGKFGLIFVEEIPPLSFFTLKQNNPLYPVTVKGIIQLIENITSALSGTDDFEVLEVQSQFIIENGLLKITFDHHGKIVSLYDNEQKYILLIRRELIPQNNGANTFMYYEDIPLYWDAWDLEIYHLEKPLAPALGKVKVIENGPLRVVLKVIHPLSPSTNLEQTIIVCCQSRLIEFKNIIDWNENRKILKVLFPFEISNDVAQYETQFG